MEILQGECVFCREPGTIASQDVGEICWTCTRKALIAFAAKHHGETDPEELAKLKEAGRAVIDDTTGEPKNLREVTADEEVDMAAENLLPK